jgi:succinate dehydrogenase/fumarate reductase-like Fe-S protein
MKAVPSRNPIHILRVLHRRVDHKDLCLRERCAPEIKCISIVREEDPEFIVFSTPIKKFEVRKALSVDMKHVYVSYTEGEGIHKKLLPLSQEMLRKRDFEVRETEISDSVFIKERYCRVSHRMCSQRWGRKSRE